jgi:hypothetical protein
LGSKALALKSGGFLFLVAKAIGLELSTPGCAQQLSPTQDNVLGNCQTLSSTLAAECHLEGSIHENEFYASVEWLLSRQARIENALATHHLQEGCLALYDLTSSYLEGKCCELARLGLTRARPIVKNTALRSPRRSAAPWPRLRSAGLLFSTAISSSVTTAAISATLITPVAIDTAQNASRSPGSKWLQDRQAELLKLNIFTL